MQALTEDEHPAAWFPTTIEGAPAAGARLDFAFRESEGEPFDGEMLAFEPPSLSGAALGRRRPALRRRAASSG